MKKKQAFSHSTALMDWVKDVGLKAFAVLAIVVGGFYVIAADIVYPTTPPNPTTGVVGIFVGESTKALGDKLLPADASPASSYANVNKFCSEHTDSSINGSHICTPDEMINSLNHGTLLISPIFTYVAAPSLWINNGPPGFTASANDCKGWTVTARGTDDDPNFGAMWIFANKAGGLSPCSTGRKFACCK